MGRARMHDHQRPVAEPQGIRGGNRAVRGVGKLEIAHGVEPNDPNPIRYKRIFPSLSGEDSTIRVRKYPGAEPAKHDGAEVVVRMMVGQHQPPDRLPGDPSDGLYQALGVLRTGERVDDDHTGARDDKAGVGPALRPASGVTNGSVYAWRQETDVGGGRWILGSAGKEPGKNDDWNGGEGQAEPKLMWIDCLKLAPLLSDQTMVSGASLSALRVKLTTGSRLIPEVHSKRATSCPP